MYSTNDILLAVGLAIGIVILVNFGAILAFLRGSKNRDAPYKALGKAINIVKDPWKKENEQIDELSDLLDSIEEKSDQDD